MGRFLKDVLVFLSVLSVVSVAADYFYSGLFKNNSTANVSIWKDVMEGKASAELLILGDSRVNTDCFPPVIDSITGLRSYAAGIIGHHFRLERLRYDMYRRYNDKPSVLVHFVDGWIFSEPSQYDRSQFFPWMWNRAFRKRAFELEPRYFSPQIPWYRYHNEHFFDKAASKARPYRGFFTYWKYTFSRWQEKALFLNENQRNERLFRTFLSDVLNDGIKVVLVQAPICGSLSFKESTLASTRERFGSIAEEYGIPFLDYLQRPSYEDSTLFLDSVHLNKKGAVVFSDSLANDLVSLGIIND